MAATESTQPQNIANPWLQAWEDEVDIDRNRNAKKDSKGKMGNLILNRWNLILASERDAKRGVI